MSDADDSSDLSSISSLSPAPSDSESEPVQQKKKGILKFFKAAPNTKSQTKAKPKSGAKATKASKAAKDASPPPRKREPSPPHEYVFADNPDIALCRVKTSLSAVFFISMNKKELYC
ncbi:hypothetical protein BROUX41_004861 [Berkeleyomyces rouxiae]|uniref:uncharacterized protein n=1 Tax=Berkeleyomyces rouxiae TaxID=2035830 RepID=UPI003B81521F